MSRIIDSLSTYVAQGEMSETFYPEGGGGDAYIEYSEVACVIDELEAEISRLKECIDNQGSN